MIIVRVELHSAITGKITELARLRICNDGTGNASRRHYTGVSFRGRSTSALNRHTPMRHGSVRDYPAPTLHVWNLVARMLAAMGYQ